MFNYKYMELMRLMGFEGNFLNQNLSEPEFSEFGN
jgi:hypothetical protein